MDGLTQIQSLITFAWWMAFSLSVVIYVVLDGADLGAGVFSLFVRNEDERGAILRLGFQLSHGAPSLRALGDDHHEPWRWSSGIWPTFVGGVFRIMPSGFPA